MDYYDSNAVYEESLDRYRNRRHRLRDLKHPEAGRPRTVLIHGLTIEEWDARREAQDGRCAICGRDDRPLVGDHDHRTLQFRGFLCSMCNTGLGMFRDDPEALAAAIKYLGA